MRAFHAVHIAVLQHGQDALPRVTQSQDELTAPAHLLAGIHGLAYPLGRGTPAADGPADPRIRVVEGRCDLDQVEHGVLDACARREHGRVPRTQDRVRPVDEDPRDLRPRRRSRQGNGNDDERTRLVDQAVPFGCCLMAQDRTRTGAEQRSPECRLAGRLAGEGGIDAALESLPAATSHTAAYRVRRNATPRGLTAGYRTTLKCQQVNGSIMHVAWHAVTVPNTLSIGQQRPKPVDNSDRRRLSVDN